MVEFKNFTCSNCLIEEYLIFRVKLQNIYVWMFTIEVETVTEMNIKFEILFWWFRLRRSFSDEYYTIYEKKNKIIKFQYEKEQ